MFFSQFAAGFFGADRSSLILSLTFLYFVPYPDVFNVQAIFD